MLSYAGTRFVHASSRMVTARCPAQETLREQLEGRHHVSDAIAKEVSSALVMAALKKGTLDNVTVVVLLLRWD